MKNLSNLLFLTFFLIFCLVQSSVLAQWTVVLDQTQTTQLNCLAVVNADTVLAGGNNQIMRTCDGGATWQNVLPGSIEIDVFDMEVTGHSVYASGNGKILKTNDNGANWSIVRQSPAAMYKKLSFVSYSPTKQKDYDESIGLVFAKGPAADTLLRTTDGGISWQAVSFDFPAYITTEGYSIQMVDQYTGYLMTDSLYKTIDSGLTWTKMPSYGAFTNFLPSNYPTTGNILGFANSNVGIIINYYYNEWKRTIDGGITWEVINRPFYCAAGICAMHPDVYYVCLADFFLSKGGVYVTTDDGANWEPQNVYNYGRDIAMATDSIGYYLAWEMYGSTANYIYKTVHGGWSWTGINDYQSDNSSYYQLTPNPVFDKLTINAVKIRQAGKVNIKISDINGRSLTESQLCSDKTTITVSQLQVGTYLYEIRMEGRIIQSGKFIKQ